MSSAVPGHGYSPHAMSGGSTITLIVPLRNEQRSFEALRRSIESQTHPPDKVIFVDAGSTDRTLGLARASCVGKHGWDVIDAGPATPGRARNVGIEAATTDWVALTDAGIVLDRHWLDRLERFVAADPTVDIVYGSYEPAPTSWFTECAALVYVTPTSLGAVGPVRDHSIASCLLRRQLWERAGGFPDLRAAEDRIFMRRVTTLGARVGASPEATVQWQLQPTVATTFRRFRTYSRVNALAGEQHHWHYRVRRIYVMALAFVALARLTDRRWIMVLLFGALLRAARGSWKRRDGRSPLWVLHPGRLVATAGITGVVDAGTFVGWLEATAEMWRR